MNSTTFAALVAVAADYLYMALRATEDFDSFPRAVRNGMREAAAVAECVERFDREVAAQLPRSWELKGRPYEPAPPRHHRPGHLQEADK